MPIHLPVGWRRMWPQIVQTKSNSPHTLPFRTDPGRQYSVAFLLSRDLGSATIISDDTWKLVNGCLLSVRLSRLVSCSRALSKRFWLTISAESFLDEGSGMLAGKKEWCWEKLQLAFIKPVTSYPQTVAIIKAGIFISNVSLPVMLKWICIFCSLSGPVFLRWRLVLMW